jgi:hypothetical protein
VETLLFAEGDLGSVLGATARKPAERLGAWDADALLKARQMAVTRGAQGCAGNGQFPVTSIGPGGTAAPRPFQDRWDS